MPYNGVEMNWLVRLIRGNGNLEKYLTLTELSEKTGVKYQTLWAAVRQGRLQAYRSGYNWLSTVANVRQAQAEGKIRK